MDLLKLRIDLIKDILNRKCSTGFLLPDQELCCLQTRKSLELIAFAGIAANLNEYAQIIPNFEKQWNGKRIISQIEKINPNFYPIPIKVINKDGKLFFENIQKDFLTKKDYIELYDWCGNKLHSFNPFGKSIQWIDIKEKLHVACMKIVNLLNQHRCILPKSNEEIWVNMSDMGHKGKAAAYIFKRISLNLE